MGVYIWELFDHSGAVISKDCSVFLVQGTGKHIAMERPSGVSVSTGCTWGERAPWDWS